MSSDPSIDPTIRHRSIDAAGVRWNVDERGTGRPLVLLHGTGGTIRTWDALAPFLADRFRLVALDLPGHGETSYPGFERLTCDAMATMVAGALAHMDLSPAAVVAHSAGAAVMLQMAADRTLPADARLIGINPALQPPSDVASRLMRGPVGDLFRSRAVRSVVREAGRVAPVIELLLSSTGSRLSPAQEGAYVRAFSAPNHAEAAYAMMANWDLLPLYEALPTIAQETLFIVGAIDRWVPPSVAGQAARRMLRARVETVPLAGHLVHEERPEEVAALIADALSAR